MAGWEKTKERKRMLMKKIGGNEEKQPTISDCVGNKNALLENVFKKFRVIHKIMKADEVRDETKCFVSVVLCYVQLA